MSVLVLATFLLCALGWLLAPVLRDPEPRFLERRGEVAEAVQTGTRSYPTTEVRELTLRSTSGLEVELSVRVPLLSAAPRPLVVLLAGQRTGRDAIHLVADNDEIVLAALSYPNRAERTSGGAIRRFRATQHAILDTTPALLLTTDWLAAQPYVDATRIELVGGSLGAMLCVPAGALDPRFRRVWLVHGAGDVAHVIEHGIEGRIPRWLPSLAISRLAVTAAGGRYLAPEHWVGRISPRPVIAINALDDESMPTESVRALHRALREPFEVLWMSGAHVRARRPDVIREITEIIFERILEEDGRGTEDDLVGADTSRDGDQPVEPPR